MVEKHRTIRGMKILAEEGIFNVIMNIKIIAQLSVGNVISVPFSFQ